MHITRRDFLKQFCLLASAGYVGSQWILAQKWASLAEAAPLPEFKKIGEGKRVIILGAGIAGLCAAYELQRAGYEVVILESSPRTGGRILTLRGFFESDQYVELGATRLPDSHFLTHAYADHFKLEKIRFPEDRMNAVYALSGQKFFSIDVEKKGYPAGIPVASDERFIHPNQVRMRLVQRGMERLVDEQWVKKLDALSMQDWVAHHSGASQGAAQIHRAYQGSEVDGYNAWAWLAVEKKDEHWDKTYAIVGGNDRLTDAFKKQFEKKIYTQHIVKHVKSSASGVHVVAEYQGKRITFEGQFCVCTVPHRILKKIIFEPGLPEKKARASSEIPMQNVTRVNMQFKRRFWNQEERVRGLLVACTDTPVERLWDLTAVQKGTVGILASYIQFKNSLNLERQFLNSKSKVEFALNQMQSFFPQAKTEFLKGMVWEWSRQPDYEGAWTAPQRGQRELFQALQEPLGRVVFAGDGLSVYSGWIQGALETAHLAVLEIQEQQSRGARRS